MQEQFSSFIKAWDFFDASKKTIIAVSGGMDSVLLCHLFKAEGLVFAIAHCNFKLRGDASDQDEVFVGNLAKQLDVPFFSTAFDTERIAKEEKQSIQLVARDLRYDWLENVREKKEYDFVATAHHANDSIETVLFNFTKGCGLRGLHGILPLNGNLIRPLLFASKKDISDFVQKEKITFREDVSNASDKYSRNHIRHNVIPALEKINPSFDQTASQTIKRLQEAEALYDWALAKIKKEILEQKDNELFINKNKLLSFPAPISVLYEIIAPFGFNTSQATQIKEGLEHHSGACFYANDYRLLVDRNHLIISPKAAEVDTEVLVQEDDLFVGTDVEEFYISVSNNVPDHFPKDTTIAFLDFNQLRFPLKLRRWQEGDSFCPLGMAGKKQKLKDFFINNKLSILEKERVWVLESAGEICWIAGYRVDERFKVNPNTRQCYMISIQSA